jgi:hypothetical protein
LAETPISVRVFEFNTLKYINSILDRVRNQGKFRLAETFPLKYDNRMTEAQKAARTLGRLGGLKGGKARAKALTPERRKEIAQKAIAARWSKSKP